MQSTRNSHELKQQNIEDLTFTIAAFLILNVFASWATLNVCNLIVLVINVNCKNKKLLNLRLVLCLKIEFDLLLELPYLTVTNAVLNLLEWCEKMVVNGNATIIEMIINFWKLRANNSLMIWINIWPTHTGNYYQIWRWFGVTVYVKFTATPIANAHLLVTKL